MLIAYVDESGEPGKDSLTYTLGCVFLSDRDWARSFDELISFRRRLRDKYSVPTTAEIKANFLIRKGGKLKDLKLNPNDRKMIYRAHFDVMQNLGCINAFAVVVHKGPNYSNKELVEEAWVTLIQRLEATSRLNSYEPVLIIHDHGDDTMIRRIARWSRRRLTAGSVSGRNQLSHPFVQLIDDPMPKASDQSLFIQMADLVAYAAFRNLYVPGRSISNVVDQNMWHTMGSAIFVKANGLKPTTTPGIVERSR